MHHITLLVLSCRGASTAVPCPGAQVLFGVNQRLRVEDVDSPLIQVRPVKTVCVVLVTGDRGLCGGYNSIAIRKVLRSPDVIS